MTRQTKIVAFLAAEIALFAAASLVHAGILLSGFEHARAMMAEAVIGALLALGLLLFLIWPTRATTIAVVAQGFALAGTMVGAFTIAVGVGPQTIGDIAFHIVLLLVLIAGLLTAWRSRR